MGQQECAEIQLISKIVHIQRIEEGGGEGGIADNRFG
jgi:hypothetical protein